MLLWVTLAVALLAQGPSSEIQKAEPAQQNQPDQPPAAANNTKQPSEVAHPAPTAPFQVVPEASPAAHPKAEAKEDRSEFWSAKLTDWLLAAFTLALVVFTYLLYRATAGLFTETAGLRTAADQQAKDMKDAITAATDSAKAAIGANQIAVMNSEQQLRAYVTVQEIGVVTHRKPGRIGTMVNNVIPGDVHTYRFTPILKNGGMTPAVKARINVSFRTFGNDGIPANFTFPDSELFGDALIGPQIEWHAPAIVLKAFVLEDPNFSGGQFLWGWIEYDDVFEGTSRHRTEFCFEIRLTRLQPTNEPWLEFVPYSRFNNADFGCLRPYDGHENKYG